MIRRVLLLCLLAAALCPAGAAAQAPTKAPGQLSVGLSMPAPGFQVGAVLGRDVILARGLEIDLARALARELAVPALRFVNEERFATLIDGTPKDYDLAIGQITISEARSALVDFSVPYFAADQGVLLRRGLTLKRNRLSALRGLRLCAGRGTTGEDIIAARIRPVRRARSFRDASRLEAELYQRRCDAVVADAPQLGVLRAQAPRRSGALVGRIPTGERYGIAFERGSALRPLVDTAIGRLEAEGTLERLSTRWLSTDVGSLPTLR